MELSSYLSEVFRHMSCADAKVWQSVLNTPGAGEDERIRRLFYHIHATQHAFLSIWEERPLEIPEPTSFPDLISVAKWAKGFHKEVAGFISGIDEQDLSRVLNIPWNSLIEERLGKKAGAVTLEECMIQVALHSSHHRGQITARIREQGVEPPLVDFIAWLWIEKPGADWSFIYSLQNKEV